MNVSQLVVLFGLLLALFVGGFVVIETLALGAQGSDISGSFGQFFDSIGSLLIVVFGFLAISTVVVLMTVVLNKR